MYEKKIEKKLSRIYRGLLVFFGPQHWWPGETPFEVCIGAILTQNTSWQNVERAIGNLKAKKLLCPSRLRHISQKKLAGLIRPSGYFNIKARRLKEFLYFLFDEYGGDLNKMFKTEIRQLREQLLSVNGIGPETCDSILLYAGNKPIFVIDAYTRRILLRHRLIQEDATYHDMQELFMENLPKAVRLYNEYHALLVRLGKEICLKNNPECQICPLKRLAR